MQSVRIQIITHPITMQRCSPRRFLALVLALAAPSAGPIFAADRTWDGEGNNDNWTTKQNWSSGDSVAGDNLFFAGATRPTPNNDYAAGTAVLGLTFNSGAAAFTLTGNSITLGANGITNSSTNLQTINMPLILGATGTVNAASGNIAIGGAISGTTYGLTKTGPNTLTLTGTNTYTGATSVSAGTLVVNGDQSGATGNVTVASGARLAGTGTVGGDTTFNSGAIHAPGAVGAAGLQAFDKTGAANANLTYTSGSIIEWDIAADVNSTTGTRGTSYDAVNVTGALTIDAATGFKVVRNGTTNFATTFWDTNQAWANIFSYGSLVGGWAANTPVAVYDTAGVLQNVSGQGYFTISGTTLNWTAVPELSNLLVGGLLGVGMLLRRRTDATGWCPRLQSSGSHSHRSWPGSQAICLPPTRRR